VKQHVCNRLLCSYCTVDLLQSSDSHCIMVEVELRNHPCSATTARHNGCYACSLLPLPFCAVTSLLLQAAALRSVVGWLSHLHNVNCATCLININYALHILVH
jgi:hypothetical protein